MFAMLTTLPFVGEVSSTTLAATVVAVLVAYFYVMGKMRPRAIRFPRSTFPTKKAVEVRARAQNVGVHPSMRVHGGGVCMCMHVRWNATDPTPARCPTPPSMEPRLATRALCP